MWRVVLGFLLCATAYPLFMLLGKSPGAAGGAALVGTFTIGATILVGVPLFAWFRKRGWLRPWQFLAGGAFAGAVAALPFLVSGWQGLLFFSAVFAGIGAVHALVFWMVAVRGNKALRATSGLLPGTGGSDAA